MRNTKENRFRFLMITGIALLVAIIAAGMHLHSHEPLSGAAKDCANDCEGTHPYEPNETFAYVSMQDFYLTENSAQVTVERLSDKRHIIHVTWPAYEPVQPGTRIALKSVDGAIYVDRILSPPPSPKAEVQF